IKTTSASLWNRARDTRDVCRGSPHQRVCSGDDRLVTQIMRAVVAFNRRPDVRNDGSGIDSLIEVMDGRADVLRLAIHERPEIGARAAIVRREAEMQVDDAALECRQQGLS